MPHSHTLRAPFALLAVLMASSRRRYLVAPMQVRFGYAPLNYWAAAALALLLQLTVLWVAHRLPRRSLKIAGLVLSAVVALPSLVFVALAWLEWSQLTNNVDSSFELLSQGRAESASYRLYRTDCGATCAYELVLRKEYDSPFGG